MKKFIVAIACMVIVWSSGVINGKATTTNSQTLVVGDKKAGVYLYATPNPKEERFTDFRVKIGNEIVETEGWAVSMSETRRPELHVIDVNVMAKKR